MPLSMRNRSRAFKVAENPLRMTDRVWGKIREWRHNFWHSHSRRATGTGSKRPSAQQARAATTIYISIVVLRTPNPLRRRTTAIGQLRGLRFGLCRQACRFAPAGNVARNVAIASACVSPRMRNGEFSAARIYIRAIYITRKATLWYKSLGRHNASKGRVVSERRQYRSRRRGQDFSSACSWCLTFDESRPGSLNPSLKRQGRYRTAPDVAWQRDAWESIGLLSSVKDCLAGAGATRSVSVTPE